MIVICAIIGASAPEVDMIKIGDVKTLFLMAESRGGHACGFTDGKIILKSAMNSYEYVREMVKQPKFPKKFSSFIGHTRFATIGNKDVDANAHPFAKKGLIGVHNGSIYNYEDLQELLGSKAVVDSEVLYDSISLLGLKKTLPLLNGILGLSYYNLKNKSIVLYRHNKPLSYGYKGGVLFWASLPEYLEGIDCVKIKELQEHTVYKVKHGKVIASKNIAKDYEPTPPDIIVHNNVQRVDKTPSLNIFIDRINHIKTFKIKRIDEVLKKKDEERSIKKSEETVVEGFNSNTPRNKRPYEVFSSDKTLEDIPMHAKFFNSDSDGKIFVWFCPNLPGLLYIYNVSLQITDGYDLDNDKDMGILQQRYSLDDSDILKEIIHEYAVYKDTYDVRQELENDKKEKTKEQFNNSVCD